MTTLPIMSSNGSRSSTLKWRVLHVCTGSELSQRNFFTFDQFLRQLLRDQYREDPVSREHVEKGRLARCAPPSCSVAMSFVAIGCRHCHTKLHNGPRCPFVVAQTRGRVLRCQQTLRTARRQASCQTRLAPATIWGAVSSSDCGFTSNATHGSSSL